MFVDGKHLGVAPLQHIAVPCEQNAQPLLELLEDVTSGMHVMLGSSPKQAVDLLQQRLLPRHCTYPEEHAACCPTGQNIFPSIH